VANKKGALNKPLSKRNLIDLISNTSGLSKKDASLCLTATLLSIQNALKEGHPVKLTHFGVFSVVPRPAHIGRNPRTRETLLIPPRKHVKFRPSRILKREMSELL